MVNVKKVGKYQVKVYKASNGNYIYLNKNDRELDKRALEAVETAIKVAENQNKPVAKYDPELKKAYLLDSNGNKQYVE